MPTFISGPLFALAVISLCLGGSLSQADEAVPRLHVYPPRVVLHADYPAQFVVVEELADGTIVDRTHDPALRIDLPPAAPLQIDAQRVIHWQKPSADTAPPVSAADLAIGLQFGSLTPETPLFLEVADTEHHSPVFPREIAAVLGRAGCNLGTCHGNLHGKGGLRLSLRGDDPQLDFAALVRDAGGRRIDHFSPALSLLLKKPSGGMPHQGGVRFATDSLEYQWLRDWVADGCQWHANQAPASPDVLAATEQLVKLDVYPRTSLLASQSRQQQLVVLATFADGAVRDVTRWARFEASSPTGVEISPRGLVVAEQAIDVSVSVSYLSGRSAARLTFLEDAAAAWSEPPPATPLDELVESQLRRMHLQPTEVANDSVFLRRVYLSVVGRLPTAEETRSYLQSKSGDKRERLVDELLQDPGYAMLWALRWSDLLRNEQKVMSPEGAAGWHAWMQRQMAEDRPLTEFVRELLTTVGSTYTAPPASFHRTHRDPESAAETIGQVFLGVRLQCARCHNHPFDAWRQDDYYGLAAYFSNVQRKQLDNQPKDKFDKHIISGDEIISLAAGESKIWHPGRAADVPPKPLTARYSVDGEWPPAGDTVDTDAASQPLVALADWLTNDNQLFARNMANRIWYHVMGRGIVDPPDDFRDSNPASNPELLEYLTDELIRSNYSIRHVSRLILTSRTFARSAVDDMQYADGLDPSRMFAGYPLRRMSAEVLYDAISDVTQIFDARGKAHKSMSDLRYIAQAEVPTQADFLTVFGKPSRLLVCECERSDVVSLGQSLMLVNGQDIRDRLAAANNRIDQLTAKNADVDQAIEQLYLTALTRFPTTAEQQAMREYVLAASSRRVGFEDVLWALLNSKEFSLIR